MKYASIPVEDVKRMLKVRDGVLMWKIKRRRSCVGDVAGTVNTRGYVCVRLKDKLFLAHRVAWVLYYGEWPDGELDHIDHDKTNNKKENLRLVTHADNGKNQKMHCTNTSGVSGVVWVESHNRWMSQIKSNGVKYHLGYFENKSDAIKARKLAEHKHGFHTNHGIK